MTESPEQKASVVGLHGRSVEALLGQPVTEIVELLEKALDDAKAGLTAAVAVVVVENNGWISWTYHTGDKYRYTLLGGLTRCSYDFNKEVDENNG